MTLPASNPISMSQVANELGLSLPLSINHPWVLTLANKSALPISLDDLLGKTGRFDANLACNGTSQSCLINLGAAQFFGAALNSVTGTNSAGTFLSFTPFNALPPIYRGNIKVTNNTTGASCVFSYNTPLSGSFQWGNDTYSAVSSNLLRPGTSSDSFTIIPSN